MDWRGEERQREAAQPLNPLSLRATPPFVPVALTGAVCARRATCLRPFRLLSCPLSAAVSPSCLRASARCLSVRRPVGHGCVKTIASSSILNPTHMPPAVVDGKRNRSRGGGGGWGWGRRRTG